LKKWGKIPFFLSNPKTPPLTLITLLILPIFSINHHQSVQKTLHQEKISSQTNLQHVFLIQRQVPEFIEQRKSPKIYSAKNNQPSLPQNRPPPLGNPPTSRPSC
jgi:hypothetical protein